MRTWIKAPHTTNVKSIKARDGSPVKPGDIIAEFSDAQEQQAIAKLLIEKSEAQAKADEVISKGYSDKADQLDRILTMRSEALDDAAAYEAAMSDLLSLGQKTIMDVLPARQDVALRAYQKLQAQVEKDTFLISVENTKQLIALLIESYDREVKYVEKLSARLVIRSPKRGIVRHKLFVGYPVGRGQICAEVDGA